MQNLEKPNTTSNIATCNKHYEKQIYNKIPNLQKSIKLNQIAVTYLTLSREPLFLIRSSSDISNLVAIKSVAKEIVFERKLFCFL